MSEQQTQRKHIEAVKSDPRFQKLSDDLCDLLMKSDATPEMQIALLATLYINGLANLYGWEAVPGELRKAADMAEQALQMLPSANPTTH